MELKMRNELATVELEALTADTEKAVEFTERDDKIVLVVVATAATVFKAWQTSTSPCRWERAS